MLYKSLFYRKNTFTIVCIIYNMHIYIYKIVYLLKALHKYSVNQNFSSPFSRKSKN